MTADGNRVFSLQRSATGPGLPPLIAGPMERLLGLRWMAETYADAPHGARPREFIGHLFRRWGLEIELDADDLGRVPSSGPVVVAANHPFGGIEGLALAHVLLSLRPDVRVMANFLLGRIPELAELFLLVDPFAGRGSELRNLSALRNAKRWLAGGGLLVIFPAGEVSHLDLRTGQVADPRWLPTAARLVRAAGCAVVPVWFDGCNGALFQAAGLLHPVLRTALLPRQLIAHANRRLRMRVGGPIPFSQLSRFDTEQGLTAYLRRRTEFLASRRQRPRRLQWPALQPRRTPADPEPIAEPVPPANLEREVASLKPDALLVEAGAQAVYVADANQIPELLREIGRLREISFRAVGEGTGRTVDLDPFDRTYRHLFVWHRGRRQVVGAYRIGPTDRLLAASGTDGLYTSTLFRLDRRLFDHMGPAFELGRSFVRAEDQRSFSGLLLLWKGIGRLVAEQPEHAVLFGPVSISADYRSTSQQLIAAFLKQNGYRHPASRWVRSRTPFPSRPSNEVRRVVRELRDLEEVSAFIADLEVDRKGVPILLRQYLKVGGRLLGFNVDPDFSNVLDVLVMVDLRTTPERTLARYFGADGAASFLDYHRARPQDTAEDSDRVRMHS